MKKVISLLAVVMILGLCACGNEGMNNNDKLDWNIKKTVDEFGDVTNNSKNAISATFFGKFSNTATSEGELTVDLKFIKKEIFDHYMVQFDLKEYGDANATYVSGDSLTLKIKVNDEVTEYPLTGIDPNGSLYLGRDDYCWEGDVLFNELYSGNDIRCIVTIGNSEYSFTICSSNFPDLCKKNNLTSVSADLTTREAVNIILEDRGLYMSVARDCISENSEQFELLTSEQITELLNGYFVEIWSGGVVYDNYIFPECKIFNYSVKNGSAQMVADYPFNYAQHKNIALQDIGAYKKNRRYEEETSGLLYELSVEDDILTKTLTESSLKFIYQIRRISDNIFGRFSKHEDGKFRYSGLLIRSNGYSQDSIVNAISRAIENDIPQINN